MKNLKIVVALLLWSPFISSADGGLSVDKIKADNCMTCHSPVGETNILVVPGLSGQQDEYVIKQLKKASNSRQAGLLMASQIRLINDSSSAF